MKPVRPWYCEGKTCRRVWCKQVVSAGFYPRPFYRTGIFFAFTYRAKIGKEKTMYQKVSTDLNFVTREKEIETFWKERDIFKKSMEN